MNGNTYVTNGPVPALWHDGKSAARHPVALFQSPDGAGLRVCEADSAGCHRALAVWPSRSIKVVDGSLNKPRAPLRLALEPDTGARLVIEAGDPVRKVAAWLKDSANERKNRALRRWALATAAVWAVCLCLYLSSSMLFSFAARIIPRDYEELLGEKARDQIVSVLQLTPGVRGVHERGSNSPELLELKERLERGAPTEGYDFDLRVLDADFVNAFAMPGGYMLVTTGLIKDCASPDELAGVLAHEMAHVTRRHGTAGMLRQQTWSIFSRMLGLGDSVAGGVALAALDSSFSRDAEREADALGAERLAGAGINPVGLADFFKRLEKNDNSHDVFFMRYLDSHPPSAEREDNIRQALESRKMTPSGEKYTPAMDNADWKAFRRLLFPEERKKTDDIAPEVQQFSF